MGVKLNEAAYAQARELIAAGRTVHDDRQAENTKARYKFPYGDFTDVHRCAVLSAESRAGQYKYTEIELAAAHLHGRLEEPQQTHRGRSE